MENGEGERLIRFHIVTHLLKDRNELALDITCATHQKVTTP